MIKNGQMESMMAKAVAENPKMSEVELDALRDTFSDPNHPNAKAVDAYARDALFRGDLSVDGKRGWMLGLIDDTTAALYNARSRKKIGPILSAFIPFVKTPMEILKQGLEYSPLGFANLPGSKDYADQIGKAMFGSTVTAMAYWLAQKGDSTWAAPKGEKEKERFYASGRKPYSIRIGDTWVGYSKLGPLAYPIAMAAAWKWYHDQDPGRVTDNALERAWQTFLGIMQFFGDQSYMTGFEDLVGLIDNPTQAGIRAFTNIPRQSVPMTSLLGWVTRIIDPIYRDPDAAVSNLDSAFVNNIISGFPVFSMGVQPYLSPTGNPSMRKMIILNAISPVELSPASNAFFDTFFTMNNKEKEYNNIKTALKERRITQDQAIDSIEELVASVNEMNKKISGQPMVTTEPEMGITDEALSQIEPWLRNVLGISPQTGTPMVPFLNRYYMENFPTTNPLPGPTPSPTQPTLPTQAPTTIPTALPTTTPTATPSGIPTIFPSPIPTSRYQQLPGGRQLKPLF
jgi:hypothetical protein